MGDTIKWGSVEPIILADSALNDAVSEWSLSPARVSQVTPLVRAAAPHIADIANTHFSLSFVTTRLHVSPIEARRFLLEHSRAIQAITTPRPLIIEFSGGGTISYTFTAAVITSWPATAIGCTTRTNYTIQAANIT